ncbi:hypothetical protein MUN77_00280 [Leucobacter allii]|uniref:UGSC family (seleno)protein n=1 Tax=Leucobacter allii TaxID=2932247 RepID=UPI001FD624F6|nr:UGSC family (seleno)protein [Leucobacter allii]UOR01800.1 hypothetical protein MUN77_00280 [Leucobacter allii]
MSNPILDPTGRARRAPHGADAPRPRLSSLQGARIGLLDNTKHNAGLFLERVAARLRADYGAEVALVEVKRNFSVPLEQEVIDRFAERCDAVIGGVGDCGSCSAAAVTDGIAFQRAGLPAAVVLTDAFAATGSTMARLQGMPDYTWVTTGHPVAVLTPEEVDERARAAVPGIVAALETGAVA